MKKILILTLVINIFNPLLAIAKKISFRAVARYKCSRSDAKCLAILERLLKPTTNTHTCHEDCKCDGFTSLVHSLITAGRKPYTHGDGGLLNPKLLAYDTVVKKNEEEDFVTVDVTAEGIVEADGIGAYKFDRTRMGHSFLGTNYDSCYEMSELEEAILGTLKERAADRQMSDITDTYFPSRGSRFAERFRECVKEEWTTTKEGKEKSLSPECQDLMMRYMPRSVYWRSRWNKENKKHGDRKFIPGAGEVDYMELIEFDVSVE